MSDYEICKNYRHAKDKRAQIRILADMNITSKAVIESILMSAGLMHEKQKEI